MPEISKKKHLLPSFCKYLLTISHGKKTSPERCFLQGMYATLFYLLALVLIIPSQIWQSCCLLLMCELV
jgi:hypothetical protein